MDNKGLANAYREVYGLLRSIEGTCIATSDIKLVGKKNAITTDLVAVRNLLAHGCGALHRLSIGSISAEEVYAYPAYEPLRQSFTVSYVRQDGTNHWQARTTPNELHRNVGIKGAVAYSTARYACETREDERHASVAVLLEVGPQFDDERILSDANVRRVMAAQAQVEADEMFRSHHPDAVIEHLDNEAMSALSRN